MTSSASTSSPFSIDAIMSGTLVKPAVSKHSSSVSPSMTSASPVTGATPTSSFAARIWSPTSVAIGASSPSPTATSSMSAFSSITACISVPQVLHTNKPPPIAAVSSAKRNQHHQRSSPVSGGPLSVPAVPFSRDLIDESPGRYQKTLSVGSGNGYGCPELTSPMVSSAAAIHRMGGGLHQHHHNPVALQREFEQQQQQLAAIQALAAASKTTAPVVRPYPSIHGGAVRTPYDPLYYWLQAAAAAQCADVSGFCSSPTGLFMPSPVGDFPMYSFRKPKRVRTAFSPSQLIHLERAFERNRYVVGQERRDLAATLNLSETQVKVWFQNRRTKNRRNVDDLTPGGPEAVVSNDSHSDTEDDSNSLTSAQRRSTGDPDNEDDDDISDCANDIDVESATTLMTSPETNQSRQHHPRLYEQRLSSVTQFSTSSSRSSSTDCHRGLDYDIANCRRYEDDDVTVGNCIDARQRRMRGLDDGGRHAFGASAAMHWPPLGGAHQHVAVGQM